MASTAEVHQYPYLKVFHLETARKKEKIDSGYRPKFMQAGKEINLNLSSLRRQMLERLSLTVWLFLNYILPVLVDRA